MRRVLLTFACAFGCAGALLAAADGDWAYWRGPNATGMAIGTAPLRWSDAEGIRWKATIPGSGHSSPVVWGDSIFLTTAVPAAPGSGARGPVEHRFVVLCYDRKTGAQRWERVARVAAPHEPHHSTYGSFASNAPVTDGKRVYAFFGSRGLYAYTLDGQLAWQKDFGQLTMFMTFGEGAWTWLEGNTLLVVLDHEGDSFLVALDTENGKAVMTLLADLARDPERAVLAVTHDHRTLDYASRILTIEDGRITGDRRQQPTAVGYGTPTRTPRIQQRV